MTVSEARKQSIRKTVLEHYLDQGTGINAEEIAARLSVSISTVRRYIQEEGGRPIYGLMQYNYRAGADYYPSQQYLREVILEMRALILDIRRGK